MPRPTLDTTLTMILMATVGLAMKSVLAKLAYATGLTVAGVLALRLVMAFPLYWGGSVILGKARVAGLAPRDWIGVTAAGALIFAAMLLDLTAIERVGAGLSRVILFTYPLLILVFLALKDRRLPVPAHMASFAITYAGLAVMVGPAVPGTGGPAFFWGVAAGFGSAATYGAFLVLGQGLMQRIGSVRFTTLSNSAALLTGAVTAPLWLGAGDLTVTADGAVQVALIVVFATVVPYFLLFEGVRRVGAARTALISLSGPAITVLAAWAVLDETLTPVQGVGFALVLLGIAVLEGLVPLPRRRERPAVSVTE